MEYIRSKISKSRDGKKTSQMYKTYH